MVDFKDILSGSSEELIKIFYVYESDALKHPLEARLERIAKEIHLRPAQLVCAVGFNPHFAGLSEIVPILGFATIDELINERNEIFINDIYKKIPLDDILALYGIVKDFPEILRVMQYLVEQRLKAIESKIEATVNSMLIEKYKAEIKAVYVDGIAGLDFAENRLNKIDSGFRAMLNEVTIITESRVIPVGEIFFRDTILPEEKRKLLNKGLIPLELVHARLADESISVRERKILQDYLDITRQNNT